MKVLHVISGLGNGGAEHALFRLCTNCEPGEAENVVVSLTGRGIYASKFERAGIPVFCLDIKGLPSLFTATFRLMRLIRQINPTVVQTWMYHADLIGGISARLAGVRNIVWSVRHSNLDKSDNRASTLYVAKCCALLSSWLPKLIISCSEKAVQVHKDFGYRAEKFVCIPNGFDCELLRADGSIRLKGREEFGVGQDSITLGMVARFDVQKDHGNLFGALKALRARGMKFSFLLVGPGISNENLELMGLLQEHGLTDFVQLLGPQSDIVKVMNCLDIHVLSSRGEAFPNVVAEAMACQIPCVVTDAGDSALITGHTGWVVSVSDPEALATAITIALEELKNQPGRWLERSIACRERIKVQYSLASMTTHFLSTWSKVASEN